MKPKLVARCNASVEPHLQPGEHILLHSIAQIGKVPLKKQIGVAAAAAIASGGVLAVAVKPHVSLLVITNKRVFLLANQIGPHRNIEAILTREGLTIDPVERHLVTISTMVHPADADAPIRFRWAARQKTEGQRVIAELANTIDRANHEHP